MINNVSLWVGLGFIVFCALIYKKLRHHIVAMLDNYIISVRQKIDDATHAHSVAEHDLIDCQHKQTQILQHIDDIRVRTQLEIERLIQKSRDDMDAYYKNEERLMAERMRSHELKMRQDIEQKAIKIAVQTCQNLLYQSLPSSVQQQLLQQTLKAIAEAGGKITFH